MTHRMTRIAVLCAAAVLSSACQSRWFRVDEKHDVITTNLHVSTTPSGAMVSMSDVELDTSPFVLPVEYEHHEETWRRQTNAGAVIREKTGIIGTILLLPVWIPASLFHSAEDNIRHTYALNKHVLVARMKDHETAYKELKFEGEDEMNVHLELTPQR